MVGEDKLQCGKRAVAVAEALNKARPDFPTLINTGDWPTTSQIAAQRTWERCVIECMKVFETTNLSFPKNYFLRLCGLHHIVV